MTGKSSRPPEATPRLAGLNVIRPRAGALRALHVDPRRGTGVNWHLPGNPRNPPAAQAGVVQNI